MYLNEKYYKFYKQMNIFQFFDHLRWYIPTHSFLSGSYVFASQKHIFFLSSVILQVPPLFTQFGIWLKHVFSLSKSHRSPISSDGHLHRSSKHFSPYLQSESSVHFSEILRIICKIHYLQRKTIF